MEPSTRRADERRGVVFAACISGEHGGTNDGRRFSCGVPVIMLKTIFNSYFLICKLISHKYDVLYFKS